VFAGGDEVDMEVELFDENVVGSCLISGGTKAYLYGYEPNHLTNELNCSWGNLMILQMGKKGESLNRLSAYYCARVITKEWMQPTNDLHEIFPVTLKQSSSTSSLAVSVYAERQPIKQRALLTIKKYPKRY